MLLCNGPAASSGRVHAFKSGCAHRASIRNRLVSRPAVASATNGTTNGTAKHNASPSPAATARTLVDIVNEGTLSTLTADGIPLGTPVWYTLDTDGQPILTLSASDVAVHLERNANCSLLVQAAEFPARAVASVALIGQATSIDSENQYRLHINKCIYFGGLDQSKGGVEVDGEVYKAAEPDVLRASVVDLVTGWNEDRADDIYRIVAGALGVTLIEMSYAELLWVDELGMYIRAEVAGGSPQVVRVPFPRPVVDERDVRSVITMASQLAWENERKYIPPTPAALMSEPAGSPANN